MLDVVFIMLIFFIVVASFLRESGLDVNRPDTNQNPPESDATSITVTITGDDQIWMEGRLIDIRAVRANIARLLASDPEQSFSVITNTGATSYAILTVTDAALDAGVKQVSWPAEKKQ
jgi:biopolymer transport protein ExbD